MENLRDLRRRRRSVINTQQITRAMKMVSAAKLRRSQDVLFGARPYATSLTNLLLDVLQREAPDIHPLLTPRNGGRAALIAIAGDRGLSGAFNGNVFKQTEHYLAERHGQQIELTMCGRKSLEYFRRRGIKIDRLIEGVEKKLNFEYARDMIEPFLKRFQEKEVDRVVVIYTQFHSALRQELRVRTLLPVLDGERPERKPSDFRPLYEPSAAAVLSSLIPQYLFSQFYLMLLESQASENGARMTAMDNATNNAAELISQLTLQLNRARQAAITTEIMEIVSGAEALKNR